MRYLAVTAIFLMLAFVQPGLQPGAAHASALDDAKAAGHLGERIDGYLGVVPGAPGSAAALAEDINSKRRARYEDIAKKRGVPVEAVAQIAGKKLVAKAPSGQMIMENGGWRAK